MYDALCYSCENENKLVEICFIQNYIFFITGGRGGGSLIERRRVGEVNKYLHLKGAAY